MNSINKSTLINMGAEEFKNLTSEVKETVANRNFTEHDRSFGIVDLWKIQRNRKTQDLSKRKMLSRRNTIV